jgi:hypothetical protein
MTPLRILLAFLPIFASVTAHKEPKTAQEIEVQRALQAAAYHVRPIQILSDA